MSDSLSALATEEATPASLPNKRPFRRCPKVVSTPHSPEQVRALQGRVETEALKEFDAFMRLLLALDPHERADAQTALDHPFFNLMGEMWDVDLQRRGR